MSTAFLGDSAMALDVPGRHNSEFLTGLDIEIRAPLNGILGLADLLLETPLDERQKEYVAATRLCAEGLLEQCSAALEFSDLDAGRIELDVADFHLPQLLRGVAAQYRPRAEARGVRLVDTLDANLPELAVGDGVRLRQVVSQLLSHAVKLTPNGSIELNATAMPVADGSCRLSIIVRDTGIGVAPGPFGARVADVVPDEGSDCEPARAPLSLAVASRLVALMQGEMSAVSQTGQGTTVSFWVPVRVPA
jgi:signal transduction histidine kinase